MIDTTITVIESPTPDGLKAAHKRGLRLHHFAAVRHWQKKFLPLHFKQINRRRYGHAKRKRVTIRRKWRQGKRIDNVDTGDARSIALRPRRPRATIRSGVLSIPGPYYFNMRRSRGVNSGLETLTVIPDELQECTEVGGKEYSAEIARAAARKQRKTRI